MSVYIFQGVGILWLGVDLSYVSRGAIFQACPMRVTSGGEYDHAVDTELVFGNDWSLLHEWLGCVDCHCPVPTNAVERGVVTW